MLEILWDKVQTKRTSVSKGARQMSLPQDLLERREFISNISIKNISHDTRMVTGTQ